MPAVAYTRSWAGAEASGGISPRFYTEAVQNEISSAKFGRPIFDNVEMVELFMAGNPYTVPVSRVTDEHRARWPRQYEAFRKGEEVSREGTPLEEWPVLNRAQVRELKAIEIHTIEDVATMTDLATQRGMGLMGLRSRARAFLDDASAMALTEELTRENDLKDSRIAALEHQVKELTEISSRLHAEVMGMKNAPNPIAAAIPGLSDPLQLAAMQQSGMAQREAPQSSLAQFADVQTRRRRRAPVEPQEEVE